MAGAFDNSQMVVGEVRLARAHARRRWGTLMDEAMN